MSCELYKGDRSVESDIIKHIPLSPVRKNATEAVGDVVMVTSDDVPNGYLLCDGREVNRDKYCELFSVIGTRFGNGDGKNTFNLPNFGINQNCYYIRERK